MKASKEEWQKEVRKIFDKMYRHEEDYTIQSNGNELKIKPNVFSPAYFSDSQWFADNLTEIVEQKKLLEIGTGTGIIALACRMNGADVTATDINECAVENAKINLPKDVKILLGDMYEPVEGKFDYIFWNHPFNKGDNPNEKILLKAGFDYKYESLEKYISQASEYLLDDGKLLLGTGNFADIDEIKRIAKENSYSLELLRKTECPLEHGGDMINEFMIYNIKKLE
ncbi:methyltransferase [Candidatus Woesearchaeota archaeon]|nr:methyltransferase [Candidatus Woesearchaeota archaeon]